jgi:cellulose synthase/poly-beta-1,6-N-acetylglucosamine synthase-like glycosyltransferase
MKGETELVDVRTVEYLRVCRSVGIKMSLTICFCIFHTVFFYWFMNVSKSLFDLISIVNSRILWFPCIFFLCFFYFYLLLFNLPVVLVYDCF